MYSRIRKTTHARASARTCRRACEPLLPPMRPTMFINWTWSINAAVLALEEPPSNPSPWLIDTKHQSCTAQMHNLAPGVTCKLASRVGYCSKLSSPRQARTHTHTHTHHIHSPPAPPVPPAPPAVAPPAAPPMLAPVRGHLG